MKSLDILLLCPSISIFVELCNHHNDLSLYCFHHPDKLRCPLAARGVYQESMPGEDSSYMEDSKDRPSASCQEQVSRRSAHCILVSDSPRGTKHSQALDGSMLLLTQRHSEILSNRICQLLVACRCPRQRAQTAGLHTPLSCHSRGLTPAFWRLTH